ncbi:ribonuclease H, partial [Trifolium medium]|nr:ribonuclease H [Trifolium medium]
MKLGQWIGDRGISYHCPVWLLSFEQLENFSAVISMRSIPLGMGTTGLIETFSQRILQASFLGPGCGVYRRQKKIKFLLWIMLHNALPTRVMLSHRGILHNNLCPRCNIKAETTLHWLRDCSFVKNVWKSIGFSEQNFFQGDNLYDWLRKGTQSALMFLFMAAVWWIWRARNSLCMENEMVPFFTLK